MQKHNAGMKDKSATDILSTKNMWSQGLFGGNNVENINVDKPHILMSTGPIYYQKY